MKIENWQSYLPDGFPSQTRVWIYQSNRPFTGEEEGEIKRQLQGFYTGWLSHDRPVKAWATVLFDQFILIMADDTMDRLCGSAVDNSIRLIKDMEHQYGISLLNRMLLAFLINDEVEIMRMDQVSQAVNEGRLTKETIFFNNAVSTKAEMEDNWLIPLSSSYLWKRISHKIIS